MHFLRQRFRYQVLSRCRNGDFSALRLIYNEERGKLQPHITRAICASLPFVTLRPAMARARLQNLPRIPRTLSALADMLSSEEHKGLAQTLDKLDSIYAGSGGSEQQGTSFVILASKRMLAQLRRCQVAFSDATFCTPAGLECRQVWNIVKLRNHRIIPMVRVLMQTKSQRTYELVIDKLKELCPGFNPLEIMCDFEPAQEQAWNVHFPNAQVHGCLFHSCKAISGKAKKLRLKRLIEQNHSANSVVRSMTGLAFLPSNLIKGGLRKLARRAAQENVWPQLRGLFTYFRNYWLRRTDILSVYNCPDRTNNACESDNRTLRNAIKFKHPNIFCFLKGVLELEDDSTQDVVVMNGGLKASRLRRASVLGNDAKVVNLTRDLREGHISCTDFLRRVSRTVQVPFNRGLGLDDDFA
ncbi:Protein stu1 [Frankliniella fusca]|uniref:Protein stu1 n=1 Tax=Frankliniella fusca TaxID=407009 RepID=A0AAE1HMC4_9NEOP|nr:Protein stu1 [Frankliniella fusca]